MVDKSFHADQLVWAKLQRYPHWPAKIIKPDDELVNIVGPLNQMKGEHYVCFFGTGDYSVIPSKLIIPHCQEQFDDHDKKKRISKGLRAAINEMKEYCLSSVALDLNSKELVSNTEDPSCESMVKAVTEWSKVKAVTERSKVKAVTERSKVKAVTEHCIANSDDLRCELTLSEVKLVAAGCEMDDLCFEPLTTNVVAKQAIDIGFESCYEPTRPKAKRPCVTYTESPEILNELSVYSSTAECEMDYLCFEPLTSKVVAEQAIDIAVDSCCEPTLSMAKQPLVTYAESPEILNKESVYTSTRLIGFLGLGEIGVIIVKKLLDTGHDVTVFDKNLDRLSNLNLQSAKLAKNPTDVCNKCELIFCCAADTLSQEFFMFDELGTAMGLMNTDKEWLKGYIEMTPMDESQLHVTAKSVINAGVPFLEVPVSGPAYFLEKGEDTANLSKGLLQDTVLNNGLYILKI